MKTTSLPQEFYDRLPKLLKEPCAYFTTPQDKEIFLLSALTVLGGYMPRYCGIYNGRRIYPTLNTFIVSDNNILPVEAVMAIAGDMDSSMLKDYEFELKEYPEELKYYEQRFDLWRRKQIPKCPERPEEPVNRQMVIPADILQTALLQLLAHKQGKAMLCRNIGEEYQPLAIRKNMQLLEKGFSNSGYDHHVLAIQKSIHIPSLQLSALLSGDRRDLVKLFPKNKEGIYNQFNYYITCNNSIELGNPFAQTTTYKDAIGPCRSKLSDIDVELWFARGTTFVLAEAQQQQFIQRFSVDNDPVQAITCYRIAMVLSMLEYFEERNRLDDKAIAGTDNALQQAFIITEMIAAHKAEAINYIQEHGTDESEPVQQSQQLTEEQVQVAGLHEPPQDSRTALRR